MHFTATVMLGLAATAVVASSSARRPQLDTLPTDLGTSSPPWPRAQTPVVKLEARPKPKMQRRWQGVGQLKASGRLRPNPTPRTSESTHEHPVDIVTGSKPGLRSTSKTIKARHLETGVVVREADQSPNPVHAQSGRRTMSELNGPVHHKQLSLRAVGTEAAHHLEIRDPEPLSPKWMTSEFWATPPDLTGNQPPKPLFQRIKQKHPYGVGLAAAATVVGTLGSAAVATWLVIKQKNDNKSDSPDIGHGPNNPHRRRAVETEAAHLKPRNPHFRGNVQFLHA